MPNGKAYVTVDAAVTGTGNNSCGYETLEQYRVANQIYNYSYTMLPVTSNVEMMELSKKYRGQSYDFGETAFSTTQVETIKSCRCASHYIANTQPPVIPDGGRYWCKTISQRDKEDSLTNEGMLLRRRAEEILQLVDNTEKELVEQIGGKITIGFGELASVQILSELIDTFGKKHLGVTYGIVTATADLVKEQMDKGLIDIGLLQEHLNELP